MNPLWNSIIVAGVSLPFLQVCVKEVPDAQPLSFLAYADLLGTTYKSPVIATGMGSAMAVPLLREATDNEKWKDLTKEDARKVLDECMKVLYYRDARSLNKFSVATVTSESVVIERDQSVTTEWQFAEFQYGYGASHQVV